MILLTYEEHKPSEKQKNYYICQKVISTDDDNKQYHKVRDRYHYTRKYSVAAHEICNLRYKTPK